MRDITLSEKLQLLHDRYWLSVGPLALLTGIGAGSSPLLFWVSLGLLTLLSANKLAPSLR